MRLASLFLLACTSSLPVQGALAEDIVGQAFRRAILKVDVSAPNSVFDDDDINICKSEGTAFLIGRNMAVTASHVFDLHPDCGAPVISLESKTFNAEFFADVLAVEGDVTVLKFDQELPKSMCALALRKSNVSFVDGVKYGIPRGMFFPTPMPVQIGSEQDNDFQPFVQLTTSPTERGESGGPIVFEFNVVGILRAKHPKFSAFSVMTPVSHLLDIIAKNSLQISNDKLCNPAEVSIFQTDGANFGARITIPVQTQDKNTESIEKRIEYINKIIEKVHRKGLQIKPLPSTPGTETLSVQSVGIEIPPVFGGGASEAQKKINYSAVKSASDQIVQTARTIAWAMYVNDLNPSEPAGARDAEANSSSSGPIDSSTGSVFGCSSGIAC
ncbi:hypothetical protein GOC00_25940 [Sinorhizobium meliloti]|nr:hypothetical protein [Sinorhizobium meliloti]MDX0078640.1 hypothetical protein [Sinorhizobium meliloti]MDX0344946.1 hypothetical protein [Sinorhizobium meliloti]